MSTLYGADVAQLRSLAQQFDKQAQELDANRMTVGNAIRISAWVGPIAVRFRHEWDSDHSRRVHDAAQRLRDAAAALRRNAEQQERASAVEADARRDGAGSGGTTTERKAPTTVADFVRECASMDDKADGIRVQKVRGEDGRYRYIVYIGGSGTTSEGAWGGRLGWDNNIAAINSLDSKTLEAIRRDILARIDDPSAEVALIGFSQGGMIAQRLADEGSFNTSAVLTYGSPAIQDYRNYGGADVIRLVHNADIVPKFSGRNLISEVSGPVLDLITGNTPPEPGLDVRFSAGTPKLNAHNATDYGWVAEQFMESRDPAHAAARESLARFGGTIVSDDNDTPVSAGSFGGR